MEHFAASTAEVLVGNSFHVYLIDKATPMSVSSFSVGAINITASHNPLEGCGFKVRDEMDGTIPLAGLK